MPETLVFVCEKRRETWQLCQKMLAELAKRQRTTTMAAQAEKRHEPFIFVLKMMTRTRFSVNKVDISMASVSENTLDPWQLAPCRCFL